MPPSFSPSSQAKDTRGFRNYYRAHFPATPTTSTKAEHRAAKSSSAIEAGTFKCFMVGKLLFDDFKLTRDGTPVVKRCDGKTVGTKGALIAHIAAHLGSRRDKHAEACHLVEVHLASM